MAEEKGLKRGKRESSTMYVDDLVLYLAGVLATTEMRFDLGWLRVQFMLYCQLGAITGNRPEAIVNLRYRHLMLSFVRDPADPTGNHPRLFIELSPEYTKRFLGSKDMSVLSLRSFVN